MLEGRADREPVVFRIATRFDRNLKTLQAWNLFGAIDDLCLRLGRRTGNQRR
jgi:hypothetical protein